MPVNQILYTLTSDTKGTYERAYYNGISHNDLSTYTDHLISNGLSISSFEILMNIPTMLKLL